MGLRSAAFVAHSKGPLWMSRHRCCCVPLCLGAFPCFPDVATCTSLALQSPPRIDFYTSNSDIRLGVTVHDWLGANCTVASVTESPVVVRAESAEVGPRPFGRAAPAVCGSSYRYINQINSQCCCTFWSDLIRTGRRETLLIFRCPC